MSTDRVTHSGCAGDTTCVSCLRDISRQLVTHQDNADIGRARLLQSRVLGEVEGAGDHMSHRVEVEARRRRVCCGLAGLCSAVIEQQSLELEARRTSVVSASPRANTRSTLTASRALGRKSSLTKKMTPLKSSPMADVEAAAAAIWCWAMRWMAGVSIASRRGARLEAHGPRTAPTLPTHGQASAHVILPLKHVKSLSFAALACLPPPHPLTADARGRMGGGSKAKSPSRPPSRSPTSAQPGQQFPYHDQNNAPLSRPGSSARSTPGQQAHDRLYLCLPFVKAALVKGNFKTIVALPKCECCPQRLLAALTSTCAGRRRCERMGRRQPQVEPSRSRSCSR